MGTKPKQRFAFEPDYAVPPGATLQETIDHLGIDQKELAARTGMAAKTINQIVKGKAALTPDTALRLERVTGLPARTWNNLEANYREQLSRLESAKHLASQEEWLKRIPTKELVARGVIEPTDNTAELIERTLTFFGVASVDAWLEGWSKPQFAFRRSPSAAGHDGALATWLRLAELKAQRAVCRSYDAKRFGSAVRAIRELTVLSPQAFVDQMLPLCAEAGVALVLVPEIKGARVNGAAKWLTPTKAMIALNLRGKANDLFWFTFFHEAGHILNDSKKELFIDVDYVDDPREHAANEFARSLLIPPQHDHELPGLKTFAAVTSFAKKINVAPGIVVGRLQREKVVPYSHLNGLKVPLEWK